MGLFSGQGVGGGNADFGGYNFKKNVNPNRNIEMAGRAQEGWINAAAAARREGFDNAIGDVNNRLGGYAQFGKTASGQLDTLLKDPSSLSTLPGYRFAMDEAEKGATRSMTPYRLGGRALKELERFRVGYADQTYGNQLQRLGSLAQTGYGMDANTSKMLGSLYVGRGESDAQKFGDYSSYAFWHEQQGMDEAKQWMGWLRGSLGGFGGGGGGGGGMNFSGQGTQQNPYQFKAGNSGQQNYYNNLQQSGRQFSWD